MKPWLAAAASVGRVLAYGLWLAFEQHQRPQGLPRSVHAALPSLPEGVAP